MSLAAKAASCVRCGAVLALAGGGYARCVYCLATQALPHAVGAPLRESRMLSDQLEALARRTTGWASTVAIAVLILLVAAPGIAIVGGLGISSLIGAVAAPDEPGLDRTQMLVTGLLLTGTLTVFLAIPIVYFFVQRGAYRRRMASLPIAIPSVRTAAGGGEQLASTCPTCGAELDASSGGLTATCQHCLTEALLPLLLVSARLAKLHQQILAARMRAGASVAAMHDAQAIWMNKVVPIIMISLGLVVGGTVIAILIVSAMR
jgi:hypothetical protein